MRSHTGEKPHKCEHCLKGFGGKIPKRHGLGNCQKEIIRIPMVEKSRICAVCDKSFSKQTNLNRHMKIHTDGYLLKKEGTDANTSGNGMELNCGKCSFLSENNELLNLHITSHQLNSQIDDLLN
jgi:uncharacterized Zn-finger protein